MILKLADSTSLKTILDSWFLRLTGGDQDSCRVWRPLARDLSLEPLCEVIQAGAGQWGCIGHRVITGARSGLSSLAVMMGSLPAKVWLWEKASRSASQARQPPPRPGPRRAQDAGPGSDHLHRVEQIRDSHRGREDRFSLRHFSTNVYPPWKAFQGYHSLATVRLFPPASASQPKTTASGWSASRPNWRAVIGQDAVTVIIVIYAASQEHRGEQSGGSATSYGFWARVV